MKRGRCILSVFAVLFCMLFSLRQETAVPVLAADGTFQKVTLSLNSNTSDSASIDLYLRDSVHYIVLDDLCALARCTQSADGSLISITQGIRRVEFDPEYQRFTDGCQEGELLIPEVEEGEYAVPALLFLNYFKAAAFIKDGTLYCRMPQFTAWEALGTERECFSSLLPDGGGRKDGKAYEPSISERYMTFRQTGPAEFTGLVSDFSEGFHAYREQRFAYEKNTGEFEPAGVEGKNSNQ